MAESQLPVLCLGEALIDVVIRGDESNEHVGGSPLNVACVLTALDQPALIGAWWGKDDHGKMIEDFAADHNVGIVPGSDGAERTSIAYAKLDDLGRADYEFELSWDVPDLPDTKEIAHLHTGSIAATLEPGGTGVLRTVKAHAIKGTVSYDPNVRPAIMESPEKVTPRIEELVSRSDVVKASDEDIAWLYGKDTPVEEVMRRWLALGPGLVVVTRGPWGAYARLKSERDMLVIDPLNVEVTDTVGAGDSFMGGLLSGLLDAGLLGSAEAKKKLRAARWDDVRTALHRATVTSGLTVSHAGAYAPSPAEVDEVIQADPLLS
ncbi:MAG: carbohydrate kinase [Actinomycetaceae bacterium]|nr:carbohydrate kinase [Actinomycetaceae bacterium]